MNDSVNWDETARVLADGREFKRSDRQYRVAIYVADCDAQERPIADFNNWVDRAGLVLQEISAGVTSYPIALGRWENPTTSQIVTERTVVLYAFIFDVERFKENIWKLRDFVHTYARDTQQGQVFVELGDTVCKIDFPENQPKQALGEVPPA